MSENKPPKISQANAKKEENLPVQSNKKQAHTTSAKNANEEQTPAENANEIEEKNEKKKETKEKVDKKVKLSKDSTKKKDKRKEKHEGTEESKSIKKKCSCCKNKCCPHFPRCCPLPLMNCLQILATIDLVVTLFNLGIWIYFHQYDPFAVNLAEVTNVTSNEGNGNLGSFITTTSHSIGDINEFHETTTTRYGTAGNPLIAGGGDGNNVKYSKIGYAFREYQQEVENSCGRKYYSDYLTGYSLEITAQVFEDLLKLTYFSELLYQFFDVSILATTCCFYDYTSGRMFLIVLWNMELLPVLAKIYLVVESRSQRLCIFQYGLGKTFRGQDALIWLHFTPLMIFRGYLFIVFTYFVASMLELGNLEHQTRIQCATLHEYVGRHEEFLRMNRNRDVSSSEDDDVEHV